MKKHLIISPFVVLLAALFSDFSFSVVQPVEPLRSGEELVLGTHGQLPLSFVENIGQLSKEVRYYLKGRQGAIYFTQEGLVFDLVSTSGVTAEGRTPAGLRRLSFKLKPVGANKAVQPTSGSKLPGVVNYFIGRAPNKWCTNVPVCGAVFYRNVYSGIDLKIYGTDNQMEYDFIVSSGVNPGNIKMAFEGIEGLRVDDEGNLVITTPLGPLRHRKPRIYQVIDGNYHQVEGSYRVARNAFSFNIGEYDKNHPLIIDPLTLAYSTYLGGSGEDEGESIAVDRDGCVYITGQTSSEDFPTRNAYEATFGDGRPDVFVTKLDPDANTLVYSTYLGGSDEDMGYGVAVDALGNAYVTGKTSSEDFPIQNPLQEAPGGGTSDAFIAKLSPSGDSLVYSTYLGGSGYDWTRGVAVDASESVYVTGTTSSEDFPVHNAYQATPGRLGDAFVTKLSPAGNPLIYSTYLRGSRYDWARDIAVNASGRAFVVGTTFSADFPVYNAYQAAHGGASDVFVAEFSPDGSTLVYATYLGGSGEETGHSIAVDALGLAYVTGMTSSEDFPTQNPLQGSHQGGHWDAFVAQLNPGDESIPYSTYLGGSGEDTGYGIAVDASGNVCVTGRTSSADFPTHNACQAAYGELGDAFVTKLNPVSNMLCYSTYAGGSSYDEGWDIAVDVSGNAYVTGRTSSLDFPHTKNALHESSGGGDSDAFLLRLLNADEDSDGVPDSNDNCPDTSNSGQADKDDDGYGDACDACVNDPNNDVDGDQICGDVDNCPNNSNADQADGDGDGVGDVCDNCPNAPNPEQLDSNADGIGDACGISTTICASLGDTGFRSSDRDVFRFNGKRKEKVTIRVEPNQEGISAGKKATVIVRAYKPQLQWLPYWAKWLQVSMDNGPLPKEMTVILPSTGAYDVWVVEQVGWRQKNRFVGDYCLTIESSQEAWKTLKAAISVD